MSNERNFDQIRYCERCGISFLWSAEEQSAARRQAAQAETPIGSLTPPTHCAGCRHLLPQPAYERGLVKWFNYRKRYGFLIRKEHEEIFAHGSDVAGNSRLQPGDLVEFTVTQGERGLTATQIRVIDHIDEPVIV